MPFSTTPMAARMSCKNSKRNTLFSKIALRPRAAGSYAAKRLCFPAFCATHAQFIIIKHSCMEIKGGRRIAGIFRRKALAPRRRCNMPAGIKQGPRNSASPAIPFLRPRRGAWRRPSAPAGRALAPGYTPAFPNMALSSLPTCSGYAAENAS